MQNYPSRPIKIITQINPGGTSDIFIRALAERLHQSLGQPLVIEPRPGGQLLIAARACAEAPADGYTICFLSGEALVLNQALYKSWPEGFERNFAPVINVFFNKQMIVANASLGIRTLDGLAAVAKAKPKTLSYSAPGLQGQAFLAQFNREKGLDLVLVPFRGGAEELAAILSGDTPIGIFGLQNFISYLQAGTLVGLAVDGKEPSPLFPNIKSLVGQGFDAIYGDNSSRQYFGLVFPKDTPKPIIDRINTEVSRILADPSFRKTQMVDRGLEPIGGTAAEFANLIKEGHAAADQMVQEAGLQRQ